MYKVLKYSNKVEGDGSGYCVIDPSLIITIEVTFPTWLEVIEAFKNHGDWKMGRDKAERLLHLIQSGTT